MKKLFTLALVMAMTVTSFAQVKSISHKSVKAEPAQAMTFTGHENLETSFVASTRSIMTAPEETELSQTFYDWQSNSGPRNFTAVWPDGFAVMCYTQSTDQAHSDRGTGLAIWDPAVGEWEFTETRVEGVKTGFGSIARYKENGLVIAAHTDGDSRIFLVEDFRQGNRNFGEGIVLPTEDHDPTWPAVQCSGENLDIVHVLVTNNNKTTPYVSPILYYQYANGEWTRQYEIIPNLDASNVSNGGANVTYFMQYDPAKPNRVAFVLNNSWSDGKAVVSEDNGATWTDRVFYKHPGINETYPEGKIGFLYPRWTDAEFDANDNLHVVYEYNGTTGVATNPQGSYYPAMGGVGYWSEVLPKNAMCIGGIGEVGAPFIIDSTYMMQDLYRSEWYWSDALHEPLPEYIGELEAVDEDGNVLPRTVSEGFFPSTEMWKEHGSYNCGKAGFATMHMDGDRICAFWSMIAGDSESMYISSGKHYFRMFGNMSVDGGNTWCGTKQILTDVMNIYDELVYCKVIPYVYTDAEGDYLWLCYQADQEPGTCVQNDENVWDNNFYRAAKVYFNYLGVEDNTMTVAPTINVYPNPAQGSFNVRLNNASNVNIFNTVGQLVKTYNNVTELNNVNLEAGVYFVNAGNQTVKVVVK